jgi:monoamine oxidase
VELPAELLVAAAVRELRALFPAARRARLLRSLVVKERDATISPAAGWDALRPGTRVREPRLFLAGDWTATGLPATIEGAVMSAERCVELVTARSTGSTALRRAE